MPTRLSRIKLTRVDTVDRGANPRARVVLTKRDTDETDEPSVLSAAEAIDVLTKTAARAAGVGYAQAFDAVTRTSEGAALAEKAHAEEVEKRQTEYRNHRSTNSRRSRSVGTTSTCRRWRGLGPRSAGFRGA